MKYCEFCGTKLQDNELCNCEAAQQSRTSSDNQKLNVGLLLKIFFSKFKLYIGAVLFLAIIVYLIIGFTIGGPKDPFDYVTVRFEGFDDGYGKAIVKVDKTAMAEKVYGESPDDPTSLDDLQELVEFENKASYFKNCIEVTVSKKDELSNGDTVTVEIKCTDIAAKHFKSSTQSYTVEDLDELERVDVFKDLTVKFEGMEGASKVSFENNSNKLFIKRTKFSIVEDASALVNGQTVTVKAECDEENIIESECIPESTEKTYTVTGLKTPESVDLFKDLEIQFDGVSGEASLVINNNSEHPFVKYVRYEADNDSELSNGDKIVIEARYDEDDAIEHGCVPILLSKEYEVQGLGKYIDKAEEISKEFIKETAERFLKEESEENEPDYIFSYGPVKYYNSYFMFPKEDSWFTSENELQIIVYYDRYVDGKFRDTAYVSLAFQDIVIFLDGSLNITYDDGSASFTTDIDAYLSDLKEDYYITVIDGIYVEPIMPTVPTQSQNNTSESEDVKVEVPIENKPTQAETSTWEQGQQELKDKVDKYLEDNNIDPDTAGATGKTWVRCGKPIWNPHKYGLSNPGYPTNKSEWCYGACHIVLR